MRQARFRELVERAKEIAKAQKEVMVEEFAYMVNISPYYAYRVFKAAAMTDTSYLLYGSVLKYIGKAEGEGEEHGMEASN